VRSTTGKLCRSDLPGSERLARLLLFAQARECAGTNEVAVSGATVGEVLDAAVASYGARFAAVVGCSAIWLNGEQTGRDAPVGDGDEVAVLPPVSGG
jgi:molybdopterin synthase sulfur carrier subunit